MSQLSFPSFDYSLLVRDARGCYLPASAEDILEAVRQVIDQKMQRGTSFTSPATVKEYLCAKLALEPHPRGRGAVHAAGGQRGAGRLQPE